VHQLGGPADTGIEAVARVKAAIVIDQRRLRLIEVANIMFGRVLRTAPVQQFPHATLEFHRVVAFADNIILMKYMTEKMSVIELMDDRTRDFIGQRFEPVRLVPSKCHIECYNILHFTVVDRAIAHCSAGCGEAVQEGLFAFRTRAFEKAPCGDGKMDFKKVLASPIVGPAILSIK
jgi:hypothetical protein